MKKEEMKKLGKESTPHQKFTTDDVTSDDSNIIQPGDDEVSTCNEGEGDDDKKKEPVDPHPLIGPLGF